MASGFARRSAVTPLGWSVLLLGVASWIAGWRLGWREMMIVASTCLLLVVLSGAFTIGRATLRIEIEVQPRRVVAGEPAAGRLSVRNLKAHRMQPLQVELPVGAALARFDIPSLKTQDDSEEVFALPTSRRGVVPIGPATSVRGDPLGLLQRKVRWTEITELLVHPKVVMLEPFGAGMLRDLEGLTTQNVSVSDLAFHSLRDYAQGDDRRYVHWRSSASAGKLLVRQFNDTRRSTLSIVVDSNGSSYGDPEDFEMALQVAGSIAVRATRDGFQALLVAGGQVVAGNVPHVMLDGISRAQLGGAEADLVKTAARAAVRGEDTSLAVLVSGSRSPAEVLQRASVRFASEIQVVVVRVVPGQPPAIGASGHAVLLQLSQLSDLQGLIRAGGLG
jgi:uncharacterized protein (DUF58 family)